MIYGMKPFNSAEMRAYLDIINEAPDPVGGKTVSDETGTTTYDAKGQKVSYQTPSMGGFSKTTNYQTGEKTTTGQVGPVGISSTERPDQSTVRTASVPLAHNVDLTTSTGIGFGGAGKNIAPGGNRVSTVTARTAQNPQGTTTGFVGQPTQQDLEKAIPPDSAASGNEFSDPDAVNEQGLEEEFPGTHGAWMHGGFKVTYDPASQTVRVQGKNQDRSHKFTNAPTDRSYHDRVQQIIDRLEDESELRENPSLVMREWMALCQ